LPTVTAVAVVPDEPEEAAVPSKEPDATVLPSSEEVDRSLSIQEVGDLLAEFGVDSSKTADALETDLREAAKVVVALLTDIDPVWSKGATQVLAIGLGISEKTTARTQAKIIEKVSVMQ